jgi:hypothetical protein
MLQLHPVLSPQTTTTSNNYQYPLSYIDVQKLQVAQQKLQVSDCPDRLKMVSYLRIGSAIVEKLQARQGIYHSGLSYYTRLMQSLSACHSQWWKTCSITGKGELISQDAKIEQLLKPIALLCQEFCIA